MSNNGGSGMNRKTGRPKNIGNKGRNVYRGKCDVRLTAKGDAALSRLAERNGVTRSEIMRKALNDFLKFNTDGGVEV